MAKLHLNAILTVSDDTLKSAMHKAMTKAGAAMMASFTAKYKTASRSLRDCEYETKVAFVCQELREMANAFCGAKEC